MRTVFFWALVGLGVAAEDPFGALTADLKPGRCEKALPGADGWFVGDFHVAEDGKVTGSERWLLYPNQAWAGQGAKACEIRWDVTGRLSERGACKACTMSFTFQAKADKVSSECPKELIHGRESPKAAPGQKVGGEANDFSQSYDVMVDAEGRATVYFAKSGREVGRGAYVDGRLGYLSPHQCKFW